MVLYSSLLEPAWWHNNIMGKSGAMWYSVPVMGRLSLDKKLNVCCPAVMLMESFNNSGAGVREVLVLERQATSKSRSGNTDR
jgi:hypothetical protein